MPRAGLPLGQRLSRQPRSVVVMANGYIDLGTWYGVVPFIGGGIGTAFHQLSGFSDQGFGNAAGGYGFARVKHSQTLAWAAMAGLSYSVTAEPEARLALGYRYMNLGDVHSGVVNCVNQDCGGATYKVKEVVTSHDVRLGMRWLLGGVAVWPRWCIRSPLAGAQVLIQRRSRADRGEGTRQHRARPSPGGGAGRSRSCPGGAPGADGARAVFLSADEDVMAAARFRPLTLIGLLVSGFGLTGPVKRRDLPPTPPSPPEVARSRSGRAGTSGRRHGRRLRPAPGRHRAAGRRHCPEPLTG